MAVRFTNEHTSWAASSPITWKIEIHDSSFAGDSTDFEIEAESCVINYRADGENIHTAPIIGSSLAFNLMVQDTTHEQLITDLAGALEGRFTVVLYKNDVVYWAGVINSPDISIDDAYYSFPFRISAVDGLALLRSFEYRQDGTDTTKWDLRYTGIDSLTDIILRCIKKIPHVATHFSSSTKFLVTAVNWYADEMTASPVASTYDPFYYTELDNRAFVTAESSGNAKFLSCYDVLWNILTAFNARIYLTDGYYLIEQIEHRANTIGSDDNYSRYYAYDGTGPTANTLTADQDVGQAYDIKKLSAGTYSFEQALKSVRARQNVNSLQNLLGGYYFDSGTVEEVTVEDVFGEGSSGYVRFTGTIEWAFKNIDVGTGDPRIRARFRIKLQLDGLYATRTVTYDGFGNPTYSALTWEVAAGYIEIPVWLKLPADEETWTGQQAVDLLFPCDPSFTQGDLVVAVDVLEVNLYAGVEATLDPADYELDWGMKDPYCAVQYSIKKIKILGLTPNTVNPKNATYEVIGSSSNTETLNVQTILGDKIGTVLNQWGAFLFNNGGTYEYTTQWGARNETRNRVITQLLAKRIIEQMYYPRKIYRGTIAGSTLSVQVPIADSGADVYILKNGNYNTARDEVNGEWVRLAYTAAELTYAPVEYNTDGYDKTTPGGGGSAGSSGGTDPGGGGASGGGSGGGNGIYGGSGTVAADTVATMSGDFTFSNTTASAGEAFTVTVDTGSEANQIKAEAGTGIVLQSTADSIQIEGETQFSDVVTSASLGANQNDYAGFDGANVGRITASTAVNISGIANGSAGRILCLHNVGNNAVTLTNADTGSSAANRFDIGEDFTLRASHCCVIQYDATSSRWRIVATDRLGRFKEGYTTSTATTASIQADTPATNVGIAIVPEGTGALTLAIPDGTSTGGNARGTYAVDLQTERNANTQVASGANSFIGGGERNTASGAYSATLGGYTCTASGNGSVAMGGTSGLGSGVTASGSNSLAFGTGSSATATRAIALNGDATAQSAIAMNGDATHHSELSANGLHHLTLSELTLGTGAQELFLDGNGGSLRATIASGKAWVAEIRVLARVNSPGGGTVVSGDIYAATYKCVIANKGGTTALVGTVQADMAAQSDASMAGASFTIAADDTNDALTVTYNPGPNEDATTQINVYAAIWYNEF